MNERDLQAVTITFVMDAIREGGEAARMTEDQRRTFADGFKDHIFRIYFEFDDCLKEAICLREDEGRDAIIEEIWAVYLKTIVDAIRGGMKTSRITRDQRRAFIKAFKVNLGGLALEMMEDGELKEN